MANLEIEGKISQKLQVVSGQSARGGWRKQDFVVEYPDGNFTAQACLTAFGDAAATQEAVERIKNIL